MSAKQELGPNQRAWIAALRSGEFKQGTDGILRTTGEEHCCLGVGCRILGVNGSVMGSSWVYGSEEKACTAPDELIESLAVRSRTGRIDNGLTLNGRTSLASANDHGTSFAEIADFCEANPEAVFTESK